MPGALGSGGSGSHDLTALGGMDGELWSLCLGFICVLFDLFSVFALHYMIVLYFGSQNTVTFSIHNFGQGLGSLLYFTNETILITSSK